MYTKYAAAKRPNVLRPNVPLLRPQSPKGKFIASRDIKQGGSLQAQKLHVYGGSAFRGFWEWQSMSRRNLEKLELKVMSNAR